VYSKNDGLIPIAGKNRVKKEFSDMGLYDSTAVRASRLWPAFVLMALFLSGAIAGDYLLYSESAPPEHWKPVNGQLAALLEDSRAPEVIEKRGTAEAQPPAAAKTKQAVPASTTGIIDINRAGLSELMTLPGIGEVKAKAILEYRGKAGAFQSVEELLQVKGIGEKTLERLRDRLSVNQPPQE
jgi:comEA protein